MSAQPARSPRTVLNLHPAAGRAPTAQRMIFGATLRKHREACSLKEKDAAEHLNGCSASKISRMEGGVHDFKEADVLRLFALYGITDDEERARLLGMCRLANKKAWWEGYLDVAPKELQTYTSLEEIAQRIRCYESGQLFGLVQTSDYTRALVQANMPDAAPSVIDKIVEFREMRAHRFAEESTTELVYVLDEVTLSRGFGGRKVMLRQIIRLLELFDHPRITFRLIPSRGNDIPVQMGTSAIFDFAEDQLPPIVYVEGLIGGLYLQDEDSVDTWVKSFDRLQIAAHHRQACKKKLAEYAMTYR
ncbi:helix-turn-helix transcriptional regulator [Streptomyces sp. V4-01]|uniref:Helix-turn-helix transcriptional regulator n=1 Tax=Actinacidiphila polyblastidii TaxID=3110430 RepID=A0ABU7PFA3_9ACTN|nr:helix-turn-helix transcriptional regulator [Streptomyces sp. V4-01]